MKHYKGMRSDKITGGGSFVDKHGYGHEILNFLPYKDHMYGYVEATRGSIIIERLGTSEKVNSINGILVVWVSKHPDGGVFIVGWYKNATVYRKRQSGSMILNRRYKTETLDFYVMTKEQNGKLLTENRRVFSIPRGKEGMGQAHVWYADQPIRASFKQEVIDFVNKGIIPSRCKSLKATKGKPRHPDPYRRQKVEKKAVERTKRHFEKLGYTVHSVERDNVGWDMEAVLNDKLLRLEVKGLSHKELLIELTPNEYKKMKEYKYSYRICVVTNILTQASLSVFSFSRENARWEDDQGNQLKITEAVSARMCV